MRIITILFVIFSVCCLKSQGSTKPWNVMLIMVDDLNTWILNDQNRYSGKVISPNLRKFASSGMTFSHAYAASPKCSPSRTAMLSGVNPWDSGLYDNGVDIAASDALQKAKSLPQAFKEKGYSIASYGKISHGWGPRNLWEERMAHRRDPIPPNAPFLNFTRGEQDWGVTHLKETEMNDTRYVDAAIERLNASHEKPFFIACGLFHPHMPWYIPQKYFDMYPLDEVVMPPYQKDDLGDIPPLGQSLTDGKSKFVQQVIENKVYKEGVRAYLATTTYADTQVGRLLKALENSDYKDNTIVVFASDHGFHLGEKNHWQKGTLWEEATHSLLMIRIPRITNPGSFCKRFVSLQNIYPTLNELCQLDVTVSGRSLVPLLHDPDSEWNSTAISAYGNRYVSIRTKDFRYIRYQSDQEELYNYSSDPHAWTNIVKDPKYSQVLNSLRNRVPPFKQMSLPLIRKKRN